MSLVSNNEFTDVFQAVVSALHCLHHNSNVAIAIYCYRSCFACAHAGCSPSMSNCPNTCDSLHVTTLLWMLFLKLQYFIRGLSYLTLRIYLAARYY